MSDVGAALVGSDLGSIPSAVATLLAFAAFVAPGFLLRAGYVKSRVRGKSQADLYILAEAVVGSLAVLAALWWWRGRDVLTWAQSGTLVDHENKTYWFFIAVLVGPYVVGVVAGWLVNTAS